MKTERQADLLQRSPHASYIVTNITKYKTHYFSVTEISHNRIIKTERKTR
jgi:hypothetical protein